MKKPKVKTEGGRVIMTATEWDRIQLEMSDQDRRIGKLAEQIGEALGTCRQMGIENTQEAEKHDRLMRELREELGKATDTVQDLRDKVVELEERVDQERGRAGQIIGAFEDISQAIGSQAKLVNNVLMQVETAGLMLQPVRKEGDETRVR